MAAPGLAHINTMLRICFAFVLALSSISLAPALADVTGKVHVIDGDTFDVGKTRVRLFGIDAPETDQDCADAQNANWPCGEWVNAQVRALYQGKKATCQQIDRDRYGRVVARCSVDGADVGRTLVSAGLAFAYRRYSMDYDLDEKGAAVNARGLHASRVQSPEQFRAARTTGRVAPNDGCVIKGNISSKGTRIYHVPGQVDYEKTGINTAKGERWFCTEADARKAGWRAAKR